MGEDLGRRNFLMGAGAGMAVGLIGPGTVQARQGSPAAAATTALRIRRNVVSDEAAADLASLRAGVGAMKALIESDPEDPRGWVLQAFLHGDCQNFTFCQHGNWYFAPWHRVFLFYFEQLIQHFSKNPDFALPYWDWSTAHSVPATFYGDGNPLDDTISIRNSCRGAPTPGRGRSQGQSFSPDDLKTYVGQTVVARIQSNPDYDSYGGSQDGAGELEKTPHNFVHRWVGGAKQSNMVQTFSPLDPIFWMHHCNIDRLYSDWLQRPGHRAPVDVPAWADKRFNDFFDANGKPAGAQWSCKDTTDSRVMGYQYDTRLELPQRLFAMAAASSAARLKSVATLTARPAATRAGVLSYRAAAVTRAEDRMVLNAAAVAPRHYQVRLTLRGLKTPQAQNTGVHVFLGSGIDASADTDSPGYVGSITYFDGHGGGSAHAGHGGGAVVLNATEAFQSVYGAGGVPEGEMLHVSLLTRALYEGVESFGQVEEVQPEQIEIELLEFDDALR